MSKLKANEIAPFSNISLGIGGPSNESSAIVNIQSTDQGVLFPRMTTAQRNAISSPKDGLVIYNTDTHALEHYNNGSSSWSSVDGVQSINGLVSKDQILVLGSSGTSPSWVESGNDTHTLNLPLANQSSVSAGLVSNGDWTSFNLRLYPQKNVKYVVKNTNLGPQDFNSVKDAVDSITDASPSNPYLILISPGIFIEDTIHLGSNISMRGSGKRSTVIQVNNVNKNVIEASPSTCICSLSLQGATGTGKFAVSFNPTDFGDTTQMRDVEFGNNYGFINIVVNDVFPGLMDIQDITSSFDATPTVGFQTTSSSGSPAALAISAMRTQFLSSIQDFMLCHGFGASIILDNSIIAGEGGGRACRVYDAGVVTVRSAWLLNFTTGLEVENTGAAPTLQGNGVIIQSLSMDLLVSHPGTTGAVQGQMDNAKITVDPSSTIKLDYTDPVAPDVGNVVLGEIRQGDRHDRLLSISKLIRDVSPLGVFEGGAITSTGGLGISVSSGDGFIDVASGDYISAITWSTTALTLPNNSVNYIYVTDAGVVSFAPSAPDYHHAAILGRVGTLSGAVHFIERSSFNIAHLASRIEAYQREAIGPIYASGSIVSESGTRNLNVSQGVYYFGNTRYAPSGMSAGSFSTYYQNGSGGFVHGSSSTVDNAFYDNGSGTLQAIPSGHYAKHTLYISGDGADEKYHFVYSQAEYASLLLAQQGNIPSPPPEFVDGIVLIATIIVKQGSSTILPDGEIKSARPIIGFQVSGSTASAFHGSLLGLLNDDHPQYLLVSGARAMTGSLNMGSNAVMNATTYNGITVEAHASRHLPNGADPLTTAGSSANISASTSNSVGIANSLSRSDHGHAISTGIVATQVPDQSNAAGTSASLARADHVHNIPTAAPAGTIGANDVNAQGIAANFARSDHQHQLATGTATTQTPDQSNAAGSSNNLSRADHVHSIPTAVPVPVADANAQGSAASFARSDHTHAHGSQTNPAHHAVATAIANGFLSSSDKSKLDGIASGATNTPLTSAPPSDVTKAAAAVGVSSEAARADHKHNISTAVPASQTPNQSNAEGTSTSLARADHVHNIATAAPVNQTPDQVNADGSASTFSRSDHIHDIPTASAVSLTANSGSTQGSAASFARSDHTHAISSGTASTQTPNQSNATGTSTNFSRADHAHNIPTGVPSSLTPNAGNAQGSAAAFAQQDHIHNVPTAAPANQTVAASASDGSASTFSRSDHLHTFSTAAPASQSADQANAVGTSTSFARADHIHAIATAAPIAIGTANSQGSASTFAKSDHVHDHGAQTSGTLHAAVTTSVNGFMSAADKTKLDSLDATNLAADWFLRDEFMVDGASGTAGDLAWNTINSNGSAGESATNITSGHPGVVRLSTTNAAGAASFLQMNGVAGIYIPGGGATYYEWLINISALATVANDYTIRLGLGDSTSADFTNGIYFQYNRATSVNWQIKTANGGTRTTTTTTTAVSTGWTKLRANINAAGTSIDFFINGVNVGTITTNVPTAGSGFIIGIIRVAGTPANLDIDYFKAAQTLTTPR